MSFALGGDEGETDESANSWLAYNDVLIFDIFHFSAWLSF